jgi:Domain of unknown function (DUF4386)
MKTAALGELSRNQTHSIQTYARVAGLLFLVSFVAGAFGEFYVPSKLIVPADATATARNILASDALFRWGFAAYLVEAVCDIGLTLLLYVLLRPVSGSLALLAAFFRLMGTSLFAVAEFFYFAASLILGGAHYLNSFSDDQLSSLALLSLNLYGRGAGIFMVFYGAGSILIGYLIFRSGYLPGFVGALLAIGGAGFVMSNFANVLAPTYASLILVLPMIVAGVTLALWLLVKGVDIQKWGEKVANSADPL